MPARKRSGGNTVEVAGRIIQSRRQTMGMRLQDLANQMGGAPGESFLSRVEAGASAPSAVVVARLADALHLQREPLMNAFGHATPEQQQKALESLREMVNEPSPVVVSIPVLLSGNPNAPESQLRRRSRLVRRRGDYVIADLSGPSNEPFDGEVLADQGREPVNKQGVLAVVDGTLGAWTFRISAGKKWIENGRGEKATSGYELRGVIIRVATERELVDN